MPPWHITVTMVARGPRRCASFWQAAQTKLARLMSPELSRRLAQATRALVEN